MACRAEVDATDAVSAYDACFRDPADAATLVRMADLKAGDCIPGPAVITENETTTIITDGQEAIFQADGCLLVRSKA